MLYLFLEIMLKMKYLKMEIMWKIHQIKSEKENKGNIENCLSNEQK